MFWRPASIISQYELTKKVWKKLRLKNQDQQKCQQINFKICIIQGDTEKKMVEGKNE